MRSKDPELMNRICDYLNHYFRDNHHAPTQREVAAAVHISPATAHRYLTAMGETGMISYNGKVTATDQSEKCSSDYVSAPVVGSVECGDPETETASVEEYVSLPTSIFGRGEFYILHAKGDSMVDAGIQSGDLVVIRRQETARKGDIVVALDDQSRNTLKRYDGPDPDTGQSILLYQNEEEYPNERILVDDLVVQGVATHVIRKL